MHYDPHPDITVPLDFQIVSLTVSTERTELRPIFFSVSLYICIFRTCNNICPTSSCGPGVARAKRRHVLHRGTYMHCVQPPDN
jgi:hypothetical protein